MSSGNARRGTDGMGSGPAPATQPLAGGLAGGGLGAPPAVSSTAPDLGAALRPASFVKRLLAWVIDGLVLATFAFMAQLVAGRVVADGPVAEWASLTVMGGAWVAAVCLYASCEVWGRASPAKVMTGLRVTATGGAPARIGPKLVRAVFKHLPLVVVAVGTGMLVALRAGVADLSFSAARHLSMLLLFSFLAACLLTLGGCLLALAPGRRAAHDWMSGTAVYDEVDLPRAGAQTWAGPRAFEVRVSAGRTGTEGGSAI